MPEKSLLKNVPLRSIVYLGACLLGILMIVFGGILPAYRVEQNLDEKIKFLKQQIGERKILIPLQASLAQQAAKKPEEVLPLPPQEKISPAMLNTLPRVFTIAAAKSGVSLVFVVPNLNTETKSSQSITVDVGVRGTTDAFRKFMVQVGGISYVQHIEEMEVKVRPDGREFKVKLHIAVG